MEFVILLQRISVLETRILCCTLELLDRRYFGSSRALGNWYCDHRPFFTDHHCRGTGINILIIISMAVVLLKKFFVVAHYGKVPILISVLSGEDAYVPSFLFQDNCPSEGDMYLDN